MSEYLHATEHYAAFYRVSPRTVRYWKEKNAPLDDDAAMPAWIQKQRTRRNVSKTHKRARLTVNEPGIPPAPAPLPRLEVDYAAEPEGMLGNLEGLRKAERILRAKYHRALELDDPRASLIREEWVVVGEQQRKAEKDITNIQRDQDTVYDKDAIIKSFSLMLGGLKRCCDEFSERLSTKVVGLDYAQTRAAVNREVEILIRQFRILGELGVDPRLAPAESIKELWEEIREVDAGLASYLPPIR